MQLCESDCVHLCNSQILRPMLPQIIVDTSHYFPAVQNDVEYPYFGLCSNSIWDVQWQCVMPLLVDDLP